MKPEQTETLEPLVRVLQIICMALMAGVLFFLVIMLIVAKEKINWELSTLPLIGIVFAIPAYVCSFIVPKIVAGTALKVAASKLDDEGHKADSETGLKRIFEVLQTTSIIRYAMLEGAMFFNVMMYFLSGSIVSLIIVGLGLAIMAAHFPRQEPTVAWIEERVSDVKQNRV